jgi:hypothetical protein
VTRSWYGRATSKALCRRIDLAESELGVLSAQCLDRRIPNKQTLIDEIAAWAHRNAHHTTSDWHFTTKDVRSIQEYARARAPETHHPPPAICLTAS